jgi:hypothetical protein
MIDNTCADGRFLMSPREMAISKQDFLYSSEAMVAGGTGG